MMLRRRMGTSRTTKSRWRRHNIIDTPSIAVILSMHSGIDRVRHYFSGAIVISA